MDLAFTEYLPCSSSLQHSFIYFAEQLWTIIFTLWTEKEHKKSKFSQSEKVLHDFAHMWNLMSKRN